ncbi:MAG: mannose-6-phosphate isomerase, class I [Spirochaetaceae bacterium]|jgi:mannose-6-phosphate isomerase|nr:mannose-6-phosphate isomerase, class I [Spirochaetaceae bacterium]
MQKNSLRIDVLGTSFTIVAEADRLYLDGLLKRYKLKIEEIQKGAGVDDPLRVAILTGFALYDEIERMRSGGPAGHGSYEYMRIGERLDDLSSQIDAVIGDDPFSSQPREKSNRVYLLKPECKHYDWGSAEWIPKLLGIDNAESQPWAEMWMGTHPGGPSQAICPGGLVPLKNLSGDIPFLFKLLAAEKPLSIQVHPNLEQASTGFVRENAAGISLDDPRRNYKDPNHKPEILCALTPFTVMAGFRKRQHIVELLDAFGCPALVSLRRELRGELSDEAAYRGFLNNLFGMRQEQKDELLSYIARHIGEVKIRVPACSKEWELIETLHTYFPGDPSVIAPLYLNVIELSPGEAVYIPAGILHSYVRGFGVELMSPSNNVLRGGLTRKSIDTGELLTILEPRAFKPDVLKPVPINETYASYLTPVKEWTLSVIHQADEDDECGDPTERAPKHSLEHFPEAKDAILIVTQGSLAVTFFDGMGNLTLERGESVFIPGHVSRDSFTLKGLFTAYVASRGL